MTWFKRTENVTWFDFLTDRDAILSIIKTKLNK
jgi:hypothetical protein